MTNKIFIGGLNFSTTEKNLFNELSKHGVIKSLRIVTRRDTGESRGFGFATYETSDQANKCIEHLDNTMFDGRRIGVKESIEKNR